MIRIAAALLLILVALVCAWCAMFGLIVAGYMPDATPEDMAWRWTVGVLAFACGGVALALVGFAGVTIAPLVSALCDKIVRTPS